MRKKILEIGPVVLSYGCVVFGIIGVILDILNDRTAESIFILHIIMVLCWCLVSVKWTLDYRKKKKEELELE